MNIYDFLKTGALEDLKLGINEKDIKFPASIIPYRGDVDEYVHYLIGDPVEVCVIEGTLSHINLQPYGEEELSIEYQDKNIRIAELPFDQLLELLKECKIKWHFYSRYTFGSQVTIITEGDVMILYQFDNRYDQGLYLSKLQKNGEDIFLSGSKM